jgi:hypothetical protein
MEEIRNNRENINRRNRSGRKEKCRKKRMGTKYEVVG